MLRRVAAAAALVLAAGALPAVALAGAEASAPAAEDSLYRPGGGFDADDPKARVTPREYSAVEVDVAGVAASLRNAPVAGRSGVRQTFRVPTPTGGFERFAVQRTQTMESKLAAANPDILTWSGRSLDNPGSTIALDVTPMGFHASVRGAGGQGSWLVDPAYDRRGTTTHLSYYAAAVDKSDAQDFVERETRARSGNSPGRPGRQEAAEGHAAGLPPGTDQRPVVRRVLRHRERAGREGHADQPGQPDLQRRPGDLAAAGQRHRPAQPRHDRQGARPQRAVRGARVLRPGGQPRRPAGRPVQPARLLRHRHAGPQPHRARPADRRVQLRRRPHRARRQRRRHRVPRRRGLGLQGQRLHGAAPAAGRLLRDRLRRARARATSSPATTRSTASSSPAPAATASPAPRSSRAPARR